MTENQDTGNTPARQALLEARATLRPCPFCGAPAEMNMSTSTDWYGNLVVGCSSEECPVEPYCYGGEQRAVSSASRLAARWNRRAGEADHSQLLASIADNEIAEAKDAIDTIHGTLRHRQQPQDATFHRGQKALRDADTKIRAALRARAGEA